MPYDQNAMGSVFGAQDVPYQLGDFQRYGPQMQRQGIAEALAGAFNVRQPWGVGDVVNAALMAMPGMRGGPMFAAEKGGAGLPRLGNTLDTVRRNRPSPEERRAGFDRLAKEMEESGGNAPMPRTKRSSAFDRLAEEMRLAEEAERKIK